MSRFFKLLMCIFLLSAFGCQASNTEKSFESFWPEFRNAVLKDDYVALSNLVNFPLEVKGVDDGTPGNFFSQKQLKEVLPLLLDQIVYHYEKNELQESSLREVIRQKKTVSTSVDQTENRVDQFEFKKIKGEWLLVRAYLE